MPLMRSHSAFRISRRLEPFSQGVEPGLPIRSDWFANFTSSLKIGRDTVVKNALMAGITSHRGGPDAITRNVRRKN
jgi:hypothetical protein